MNQVILVGRLVYEPEVKTSQSGISTLNTRIAVSRNDKDRTTDFIHIHAFRTTAEFIGKYFHKGDPISVNGKLQTSTWEKQDGTKKEETYVLVNEVCFVPAKKEAPTRQNDIPAEPVSNQTPSIPTELPFEI